MERIKYYFNRKKGETYYQNQNSIILQRTTHSSFQRAIENIIGPGARMILYSASKTISKKRFFEMVNYSREPPEKILRLILGYLSKCGYGLFDIKAFGKNTVIEVTNCFNAIRTKSDKPNCYVMAGTLAGIVELITGKEHLCVEDKCAAKGDKACTFSIRKTGKKAEPVRGWWKTYKNPTRNDESFMEYEPRSGEIFFIKANSIINARPEECEYQKEFQRTIGPAYKTVMYKAVGKDTAEEGIGQMQKFIIKIIKAFSKKKLVEKLLEQSPQRGFGVAKLLDFNEKEMTLRISVENSYNAIGYERTNEPVCHVLAGIFAGGSTLVFGREMRCRETKCMAMGDPHCEFEVRPEPEK